MLVPNITLQVAADAQRMSSKVLDHFNGSLVQHVVYYGNSESAKAFYGSLAQRTGGMLMQPNVTGQQVLSTALLHIVKLLLSQFPGGPPPPAPVEESEEDILPPLQGFYLYDLEELNDVETEEVRGLIMLGLLAGTAGQVKVLWWVVVRAVCLQGVGRVTCTCVPASMLARCLPSLTCTFIAACTGTSTCLGAETKQQSFAS
jgi:hypothetical protein